VSGSDGVEICGGCGAGAAARRTACGVCSVAFPTPRLRAPASGVRYWVAVRGGFTCRSCGFLAPLDHLPVDGAVECASCGLRQAFQTGALAPALAHAHAVGDLAGPSSEGRTPHPRLYIGADNPFKSVAVDRAFDDFSTSIDGRPVRLEAGPGHPICKTCHVPLETNAAGGVVATRCPRCNEEARFALPEGIAELAPGLVGVVAADHSDKPRAKQVVGAGGVVALACPACGAPLAGTGGERSIACAFCKAVALIPARAAAQTSEGSPKPSLWWLLFEGASDKRVELETPVVVPPPDEGAAGAMLSQLQKLKSRFRPGEVKAIETAPEAPGVGVAQLAVSVVVALVFLAICYPIAASVSPDMSPAPTHRAPTRTRHR
jgi:LSD1 subclass zinc finger protein